MNDFIKLLVPNISAMRNSYNRLNRTDFAKACFLVLLIMAFWLFFFWGASRVLTYLYNAEIVGELLVTKLMSILFITILFALVFSNIITTLSTYFLSDDLNLILSSPADWLAVFYSRFAITTFHSSWMVLIFLFPVFAAYGYVFSPHWSYYIILLLVLMALMLFCAAIGIMLSMLLVNVFPARKTMDMLVLLSLLGFCGLYILFRIVQPERLVNPDEFASLRDYFVAFQVPSSIFLPNYWATQALMPKLLNTSGSPWFYIWIFFISAGGLVVVCSLLFESIYFSAWSKAQEARTSRVFTRNAVNRLLEWVTRYLPLTVREMMIKDLKIFFRDASQWSQLLMLAALVVVYLYNFKALSLEQVTIGSFWLQYVIVFANIALAGFVLAAVALRFIYPSISLEGRAMWIIKSSPITMRSLVFSKFTIAVIPLTILAEALILISNRILQVNSFIMGVSTITIFLLCLGIVSLGIGFGSAYPRFKEENVAKIASSYGGIAYMASCVVLLGVVLLLESVPTYWIFLAQHRGFAIPMRMWNWIIMFYGVALLVCLTAIILPMYLSIQTLERLET